MGSGASTHVSCLAAERNQEGSGGETRITAIEPYPDEDIRQLNDSYDNLKIVESDVEDAPVDIHDELESGDILFIDSSHVVSPGNDVAHLYLRILPLLPAGVYVHVHDIHFPQNLPKDWIVDKHRLWTEQYLLQAFLAHNDEFEIVWAGHHMATKHGRQLEAQLPDFEKVMFFLEFSGFEVFQNEALFILV